MSDPLPKRAAQVRLVEIANLIQGVGDRNSTPQEGLGLLRPFNLADMFLRQTRSLQEAMPEGAGRYIRRRPSQRGVHHGVIDQDIGPRQPVH